MLQLRWDNAIYEKNILVAEFIIFCGIAMTVGWLFHPHSQPPSFFPISGIEARKSNTHILHFAARFGTEPALDKEICVEVSWSLLGKTLAFTSRTDKASPILSSPCTLCSELPWDGKEGEAKTVRDTTNLMSTELSLLLFPASRCLYLDDFLCQKHKHYFFRLPVVELSVLCSLEHS